MVVERSVAAVGCAELQTARALAVLVRVSPNPVVSVCVSVFEHVGQKPVCGWRHGVGLVCYAQGREPACFVGLRQAVCWCVWWWLVVRLVFGSVVQLVLSVQ